MPIQDHALLSWSSFFIVVTPEGGVPLTQEKLQRVVCKDWTPEWTWGDREKTFTPQHGYKTW